MSERCFLRKNPIKKYRNIDTYYDPSKTKTERKAISTTIAISTHKVVSLRLTLPQTRINITAPIEFNKTEKTKAQYTKYQVGQEY